MVLFPVVFLMDMHNRFSDEDVKSEILIHKDHGIASLYIDTEYRLKYKTSNYELMKALINKQKLEEEQRILYVAMTRARSKLYITAVLPRNKDEYSKRLRDSMAI